MRLVSPWRRWRFVAVSLLTLAVVGPADAQQPSKELSDLRETASDLYKSGDFAQSLRFYQRATPLVIREYGAEHEQTAIHYYSLGLTAEAAGNLAVAERYYRAAMRVREKVYGPDSAGTAMALDQLGAVYLKMGRPDAADPLFQRGIPDPTGYRCVARAEPRLFCGDHANLGDVGLARGDWPAALASYREAMRLLDGAGHLADDRQGDCAKRRSRRYRETFIGLCRAAWQMGSSPGADAALLFEETFAVAQLAWATSAASALAKMSARLGAGSTPLGQRIRRVQDLSDRVLRLNGEDNALLTNWSAVQRQDARYTAVQEEFRAASLARGKATAPTVKRQTELVQQLTGLMQRCPPGQKKAGCEGSEAETTAIGQELGELSKAIGQRLGRNHGHPPPHGGGRAGVAGLRAVHRPAGRLARRNRQAARTKSARRASRSSDHSRSYAALTDPKPLAVADVRALLRDDEALIAILVGSTQELRVGADARACRVGRDRGRQQGTGRARDSAAGGARSAGAAGCGGQLGKQGRRRAGLRSRPRARALPAGAGAGGRGHQCQASSHRRADGSAHEPALAGTGHGSTRSGRSPQETLRRAAWLIKSHALSVLPSVQSLSALARADGRARGSQARSSAWAIRFSRGPIRQANSAAPR